MAGKGFGIITSIASKLNFFVGDFWSFGSLEAFIRSLWRRLVPPRSSAKELIVPPVFQARPQQIRSEAVKAFFSEGPGIHEEAASGLRQQWA